MPQIASEFALAPRVLEGAKIYRLLDSEPVERDWLRPQREE